MFSLLQFGSDFNDKKKKEQYNFNFINLKSLQPSSRSKRLFKKFNFSPNYFKNLYAIQSDIAYIFYLKTVFIFLPDIISNVIFFIFFFSGYPYLKYIV